MVGLTLRLARTAVVASALSACIASPCLAGHIDKSGQPQLNLTVAGSITERCKIDQIDNADLGDLTQAKASSDTDIGLQCNLPFKVVLTSVNGGLRNVQHPDGLGPYAGVRGYELTFDVPVLKPHQKTIEAQYSAQDLVAGQTISSEGGVAFNGAHIHLDLAPVADPGLAAGDYSETIELSISPSV